MKQKFSKKWKSSKQPRKQRKYKANAPIHIKRKMLSVNLSKDLRKKMNTRNVVVRKGDKVKIMKGKFKGKTGKVDKVFSKLSKVIIEGITTKKLDGSKVSVKLIPSNLQIIELYEEDKKRFKRKEKTTLKINEKETKEKPKDTKKQVNKANKEKK